MATLSQATAATRTVLKWTAFAFAAFLVIRLILFPIGKAVLKTYFPKKPPPPTIAFGKLPKIPFPTPLIGGQKPINLTFVVQTTTGSLPSTCIENACQVNKDPTQPVNIPDRLSVFKVIPKQAGFSSYETAKQKVRGAGFSGEGKAASPIAYVWQHTKNPDKQITFNTITESFTLTSAIASPSSEQATGPQAPPAGPEAITIAKTFLSNMSLLPKDIDDEKTRITLLKLRNGLLVKATSLSDSSFVQVDFYRKPLLNIPIVYPNPQQSLLSLILKGEPNRDESIVEAHFAYKLVDEEKLSTYPIKTALQAFDELKLGRAYIAPAKTSSSLPAGRQDRIPIQKVYLAYYEGNDELHYFLPIFVFEGENFLAFVEAVKEEWLE